MKKHLKKVMALVLSSAMMITLISVNVFAYDRQEQVEIIGGSEITVYAGTQNSNDKGNYLKDPGDYEQYSRFHTKGSIVSASNITSSTNFVRTSEGTGTEYGMGGVEGVSWDPETSTLTLDNASGTVITIKGPEINPYEINTYNDKLNPAISDGAGLSDLSWAENLTYYKQFDLFERAGSTGAGAPHTKDNTTKQDIVTIYLTGCNTFNNIAVSGNIKVVFAGTGCLNLDASGSWDYDDYNDPAFEHMSDASDQALASIKTSGFHGNLSGEVEIIPMQNEKFREIVTEWYEYALPEFALSEGMQITSGGKLNKASKVGTDENGYAIWQSFAGEGSPAKKVTIQNKAFEGFTDVTNRSYYYDAVNWAADENITKGYSDNTFRPGNDCTRTDMMIFLWRMAGSPEKDKAGRSYGNAKDYFSDIISAPGTDGDKAIAWGYKEGIVKGYPDGTFGQNKTVARKDAMIMLYRLAGEPEVSGEMKFSDVSEAGYNSTNDTWKAILWGAQEGITNGYSSGEYAGQFGININCKREHIVTFLYRYAGTIEPEVTELTASEAVKDIFSIGFVDLDGAKVSTVVIEYNVDLDGAEIDASMFDIKDYGMTQGDEMCALGKDPGKVLRVYVNDKPEASVNGGTGNGRYVIAEVNTDYQLASVIGGAVEYKIGMAVEASQTGIIRTDRYVITPDGSNNLNYEAVEVSQWGNIVVKNYAVEGKYIIEDIDKFELHTKEDGTAYHATGCFDEETGEKSDIDLPYALFVPKDYDASKKYMAVLHVHDASAMGDDPIITLTESKAPVNYASDEVQEMAKKQGYAGIIVVAPQFNNDIRTARDNWSFSAGVSATWQLMDEITGKYNIDMDRIYASGQSMGGMQIMAMAAQRDNYFAAIWPIASQWGTNYELDTEYQGNPYFEAPADGKIIYDKDADGKECNYRNLHYMLSDDNILVLNCADDMLSTLLWKEFFFLIKDLTGVEIERGVWNPLTNDADVQNEYVRELVSRESRLGIYWAVMEGGSHGDSWVYAHKLMGCYEWLLSQTKESENERAKLDLDKPFEAAEEQIQNEERLLLGITEYNDTPYYYVTGKAGAGTDGYNSVNYGRGGQTLESLPGWTKNDPETYGKGIYIFSFN